LDINPKTFLVFKKPPCMEQDG